jgi:hypothetical protein
MADYSLKRVPKDILDFIKAEQVVLKKAKGVRVFSLDLVVYHLLRELKACRTGKKYPAE